MAIDVIVSTALQEIIRSNQKVKKKQPEINIFPSSYS